MPHSLTDLSGLPVGAEGFLTAVLAAVAQPIWVVDSDGLIRFANPAAIAALGYDSPDELFGCRSHETIHYKHPDGSPFPASECPLLLPRTTGETVARDLDWFVRRDGSMLPVSYVSVPLEMANGRGAVVAFTDIEDRVRAERVLREHDAALARQLASLRRVATLVAGGTTSAEVFAAIAEEVARVLGVPLVTLWRYAGDGTGIVLGAWSEHRHPFEAGSRWPLAETMVVARVKETGRPTRIDDVAGVHGTVAGALREVGLRSGAGAPIVVDGEIWGAIAAGRTALEPLPDRMEDRLAEFTELVGTAISNTASREQRARLAEEQAGLRRVATLVARESSPTEVFRTVAEEVARLLRPEAVGVLRFEPDGTATLVAQSATPWDPPPLGTRFTLEGQNPVSRVFRTGEPVRLDDWEHATGSVAAMARSLGIRSCVAVPIVVEGRLWGTLIAVTSQAEPLPADTESRTEQFTELVATAISNAEARGELSRLAAEQAALRRVATRVAEGAPPSKLFGAVTEEVGRLLEADLSGMIRYVSQDTITPVATWAAEGDHPAVHGLWPLEGDRIATTILRTSRPARVDDWAELDGPIAAFLVENMGVRSSVGSPIVVEGRVWGALFVHSKRPDEPMPVDTEARLTNFAELVSTAISNAQARAEVRRLADEQAALRRVATLVAREAPSEKVLAAVAEEAGRLLDIDAIRIVRYEGVEAVSLVAIWGESDAGVPLGTRLPLGGDNIASRVLRTGRPTRMDDYTKATGPLGVTVREAGTRAAVGTPIVVDGRLWGVTIAASTHPDPLPADTEAQMEEFTELVATAISNTEARSELAASRARIVAAADQERRRVVRDLHDGAQQRLVHTVLTLKLGAQALEDEGEPVPAWLMEALEEAQQATRELRELSHGILPAVLSRGGLRPAVRGLASRMPVPVEIDVPVDRLAPAVEATAYFVVAEALTNVAKHARARRASVTASITAGTLLVVVRDDGVGGARPDGSGLLGLADRLAALDGRFQVDSPPDRGTVVTATIPISA